MKTTSCNSNQIDAFLANNLSETEQAEFERHLDECEACCAVLQRRAADITVWDSARRYLNSDDGDLAAKSDDSAFDLHGAGGDDLGDASTVDHPDRLPRLDFLAPTDDPRMLGRFAGYEIAGVVGCGGMGIVLKGFDSALGRYAAIKVLAPHFASSGASRQRFAREAQAAAAVVHDNVIAIHGVSEFNGLPYLVMPYVKGISLQKRIDRGGPLELTEILRIGLQTARGLAAAHDQGLVHRDIKPGNILLPENVERVFITDFGLARAADDASLTRSGVIAGTPQYMSPEQARGEAVDHRSDLFSLGCVMYAMAAGHVPFRAETPYGILRRITDSPHRPLSEVQSEIPVWLCTIVDRLLEKQAASRFASAHEVANLLEGCLAHMQQPKQTRLPTCLNEPPPMTRRRVLLAGLLCGLMIAACAVAFRLGPWSTSTFPNGDRSTEDPLNGNGLLERSNQDSVGSTASLPEQEIWQAPTEDDLRWQPDDRIDLLESTMKELTEAMRDEGSEHTTAKGIHE